MTQEDKELLLKDLSARLPYHVRCKICLDEYCKWNPEYDKILVDAAKVKPELPSKIIEKIYTLYGIEGTRAIFLDFEDHGYGVPIEFIKPYLRPMSSMTEEEIYEFQEILGHNIEVGYGFVNILDSSIHSFSFLELQALFDWLNARHFDYRGLIEKRLALAAQEGMYNLKEK